jgi:hypothetical protein
MGGEERRGEERRGEEMRWRWDGMGSAERDLLRDEIAEVRPLALHALVAGLQVHLRRGVRDEG